MLELLERRTQDAGNLLRLLNNKNHGGVNYFKTNKPWDAKDVVDEVIEAFPDEIRAVVRKTKVKCSTCQYGYGAP